MTWIKIIFLLLKYLFSTKRALVLKGSKNAKNFISEKELNSYIREFLESYGHTYDPEQMIVIKIIKHKHVIHRSRMGDTRFRDGINYIRIFMPNINTRKEFISVLFHELDHVMWNREKGPLYDVNTPYVKRPHEIRANKRSRVWAEKILGT
ncbi:MAG: hypothetical protein R3251_00955 [Candidatus Spechtbacterales bacterium]|nr:hypothetical protein [Candidatus Spechtbacterales bacterium]